MNRLANHLNILLVCCNIMGLGSYVFGKVVGNKSFGYLLVIFFFSLPNLERYSKFIRLHFCLIALLSVVSAFLEDPFSTFTAAIALAYSTNLGYLIINQSKDEMKIKLYESMLNLSFSLAVFLSFFSQYIVITDVTAKILILILTLPNFYLSNHDEHSRQDHYGSEEDSSKLIKSEEVPLKICNKLIYCLSPLLSQTWPYALGYSIGIFINIFQIVTLSKYIKYFIVALFILIETLTYKNIIKLICLFLRAILVFHFERNTHPIQSYFVLAYLLLANLNHEDITNMYLLAGYLLIAITLWREDYHYDSRYLSNPHLPHPPNDHPIVSERVHEYDHSRHKTEKELELSLIENRDYSLYANYESRRMGSY